jgi:hypothetical protein
VIDSSIFSRLVDIHLIGEGGSGRVWLVHDPSSQTKYALKRLRSDVPHDHLKRFLREIHLQQGLSHPHIVPILAARIENPPFSYLMPYYPASFASRLQDYRNNEPLLLKAVLEILDGLTFAHSRHIIHRDLKPENILVDAEGSIAVGDFGLGRFIDSDSTRQTQSGFGMGSILYMPPEQLYDAKHSDKRADIFALGRIILEAYTTSLHLLGDVDSLRRQLPLVLQQLIERCIDPIADQRYSDAPSLHSAWSAWETVSSHAYFCKLAQSETHTAQESEWFAERVRKTLDPDVLFTFLTSQGAQHFLKHIRESPALAADLVKRWIPIARRKVIGSQWKKTIVASARRIYYALPDVACRGPIFRFLSTPGTGFDPTACAKVLEELITSATDHDEVSFLAAALRAYPPEQLEALAHFVQKKPANSLLAAMIESTSCWRSLTDYQKKRWHLST